MNILLWIILGGLAGWIASIIVGNNQEQGLVGNIAVGVVGALVGGFIFRLFGGSGVNGFNIYSLVVAVVGAVILLWIVQLFRRHG